MEEDDISGLMARIVPQAAAVAEAPIGDHEAVLFPEEAARIASAVISRRREFATGRMLARRALLAIGGAPCALPSREDRAPVWPEGFIGSITHTRAWCAAAVARRVDLAGIGIDLEIVSRIPWSIMPRITTEAERRALGAAEDPLRLLAVLFSAKEAWFKCQFPLTGVWLDFDDVELTVDWMAGRVLLWGKPGERRLDPAECAEGRFACAGDTVATVVTMASDGAIASRDAVR